MRKLITTLLLTLTVVGSILISTNTVEAATSVDAKVVAQVFDATYYASANPDVVAVLGNDSTALLNHYILCGMYEGRDASGEFNLTIYKSVNLDLAQAFGDNYTAYFTHWLTNGKAEDRKAYDSNMVTNFTGMTKQEISEAMILNTGGVDWGDIPVNTNPPTDIYLFD